MLAEESGDKHVRSSEAAELCSSGVAGVFIAGSSIIVPRSVMGVTLARGKEKLDTNSPLIGDAETNHVLISTGILRVGYQDQGVGAFAERTSALWRDAPFDNPKVREF